MTIVWIIVQFAASLALLYFGANGLVRGAAAVAARLGLSSFVIGLTIVGFGTSTPELVTSLLGGETIAIGNVAGSNLFNLGIVLGLAVLVRPIACEAGVLRFELPVMVALGPLLLGLGWWGGGIGRWGGALMLALLVAFVAESIRRGRLAGDDALPLDPVADVVPAAPDGAAGRLSLGAAAFWIGAGLVMLVVGGQWLVTLSIDLATRLGASERLIALTIVAGGTSLPELATSLVAALRREGDIALGNVLGSNVFNVLGILGVAALVRPIAFEPSVLRLDLPAVTLMQLLALPIMLTGMRVSRAEGGLFLAAYLIYLGLLFGL